MAAIRRIVDAQRGQRSASNSKTRWSSAAQRILRVLPTGRSGADPPRGPPALVACE
jgi:hypothetical protein